MRISSSPDITPSRRLASLDRRQTDATSHSPRRSRGRDVTPPRGAKTEMAKKALNKWQKTVKNTAEQAPSSNRQHPVAKTTSKWNGAVCKKPRHLRHTKRFRRSVERMRASPPRRRGTGPGASSVAVSRTVLDQRTPPSTQDDPQANGAVSSGRAGFFCRNSAPGESIRRDRSASCSRLWAILYHVATRISGPWTIGSRTQFPHMSTGRWAIPRCSEAV